jgi:hypothetical protein
VLGFKLIRWCSRYLGLIDPTARVWFHASGEDSMKPLERAGEMARGALRNLIYFRHADRGGHFAMWKHPELFAAELRAAFRSLRGAQS